MPVFDFFHWNQEKGHTLTETGALLQVTIGLPTALEQYCAHNSIAIPPPVAGWAMIDTGASASAVDEEILTNFGIQPVDSIPMSTPHSKEKNSFVYPTKIGFPGLSLADIPMLNAFRVVGCELKWTTFDQKEVVMLLGRDLLRHFLMVYNGVHSDVTLSY